MTFILNSTLAKFSAFYFETHGGVTDLHCGRFCLRHATCMAYSYSATGGECKLYSEPMAPNESTVQEVTLSTGRKLYIAHFNC
jgi:hypothetical protein